MRTDVLGIAFDPVTMEEAVSLALERMADGPDAYICTPNPEIVWRARKDPALRKAVNDAFLILPDGIGIYWASRRLGRPVPERVAGYDFLLALLSRMSGRAFLLGGRPGVAQEAARTIQERYPAVEVVGCQDGYSLEDGSYLQRIRQAAPDILLVCLGAPKQELWMAEHSGAGNARLMVGLGGSLDILSGQMPRAPQRWRDMGLEWAYRLLKEPRRIRRQIWLPFFAVTVLLHSLRIKKGGS